MPLGRGIWPSELSVLLKPPGLAAAVEDSAGDGGEAMLAEVRGADADDAPGAGCGRKPSLAAGTLGVASAMSPSDFAPGAGEAPAVLVAAGAAALVVGERVAVAPDAPGEGGDAASAAPPLVSADVVAPGGSTGLIETPPFAPAVAAVRSIGRVPTTEPPGVSRAPPAGGVPVGGRALLGPAGARVVGLVLASGF
jgi:hypothetical protein